MRAFPRRLHGLVLLLAGSTLFGTDVSGALPQRRAETVAGRVTVLQIDHTDPDRARRIFLFEDAHGKQIELLFDDATLALPRSGDFLRARGRRLGPGLVSVESVDEIRAASPVAALAQTTLVVVADFLDEAVACTVNAVEMLMFTDPGERSVDAFYRETSLGAVSVVGDVVGPYAIDYRTTDACSLSGWAIAADAAAEAHGIDLSLYSRMIYVLPRNNPCGYVGVGQVGGSTSRAWVFRCDQADVFAHELGHNLGMGHAATPSHEYGDTSDVMGIGGFGLRQLSAPHQEQMGWRSPAQIVTLTEGGLYDVVPLELDVWEATAPQILRIPKLDTGDFYYLSLRAPIGFDASLPNLYFGRLSVHRYQGDGSAQRTFLLQTLAQGESFVDTVNGVTVTHQSHTAGSLTVDVRLDAGCVPGAPELTVSPTLQTGRAGDALQFAIAVRNTDGASCSPAGFSLGSTPPVGWGWTFAPSTLTLSPGQTGSATLTVTSHSAAAEGSYDVSIEVSDGSEPIHERGGLATYHVEGSGTDPDTEPPAPPGALSASVARKKVNLAWTASSDDTGVAGYRVWRDGLPIGEAAGTSFSDASIASGASYRYWVTASDAAGNVSGPSNTVTVTIRNGGGGKGRRR